MRPAPGSGECIPSFIGADGQADGVASDGVMPEKSGQESKIGAGLALVSRSTVSPGPAPKNDTPPCPDRFAE
jgi:hypothetical protein